MGTATTLPSLHIHTHTDEDGMLAEFVKTMNGIADGTPKDIRNATDDTTFERKSRELVTLYRCVIQGEQTRPAVLALVSCTTHGITTDPLTPTPSQGV